MGRKFPYVLALLIFGAFLSGCTPHKPANLYGARIDAEVASKNWINEEGEVKIHVDQTLSNKVIFDQEAERLTQECLETPRRQLKSSKAARTKTTRYNSDSYFCDRIDIKLVTDNGRTFLIKPRRVCAWAQDEKLFICQEVIFTSDYATRDQWREAKRTTQVFRYEGPSARSAI